MKPRKELVQEWEEWEPHCRAPERGFFRMIFEVVLDIRSLLAPDPRPVVEFPFAELIDELQIDGKWIKNLRKQHGLTQCDLAKLLHTVQVTISRWETNASKMSPVYRRKLLLLSGRLAKSK